MRAKKFADNADRSLLKAKRAKAHTEKMAWLCLAQSWLQLADAASITMRDSAVRRTSDSSKTARNYVH